MGVGHGWARRGRYGADSGTGRGGSVPDREAVGAGRSAVAVRVVGVGAAKTGSFRPTPTLSRY